MEKNKGLLAIKLDVKQIEKYVRLNCTISNIGSADIQLDKTFLFIDEGIYNESTKSFDFPFFQKKFLEIDGVDDSECIGHVCCRKNDPVYPKNCEHIRDFYKNENVFCNCYPLPHLSSQSILYLGPKETMNEEIVLKLDCGVYRGILMCVPNEESCDCICCNSCFVIQ